MTKPRHSLPHIRLEIGPITDANTLFEELLNALGAPEWHGRNLDALTDSLVVGDVNAIEPPFVIEFAHSGEPGTATDQFVEAVKSIARDATANGRVIEIRKAP